MTKLQNTSSNWVEARISKTSDSWERAIEEGLTKHVFIWRDKKRVRLEDGTEAIEFVSCSYLGLEVHAELVKAATKAVANFGVHFSSSRNRFCPLFLEELEELLTSIHSGAPTLCFTSVSNVHLGVLPLLGVGALPNYPIRSGGVMFLVEKTAHASMQVLRGIYEQIGPVKRFDLQDQLSLRKALHEADASQRTPILLVDGVGSMGGLIDIVGLREDIGQYGGILYIDDAHGTSIAGKYGGGFAFSSFGEQLPPNVIIVGSLSKAFGGAGGYVVLTDKEDMHVLRKFANPLVFGHSIMLPMLAADVASAKLHLGGEVTNLQEKLWKNTAILMYFPEIKW